MTNGCLICGKRTEAIVQVWLREMLEERYEAPISRRRRRKERSVSSRRLRLCREHGVELYDKLGDVADAELEVA